MPATAYDRVDDTIWFSNLKLASTDHQSTIVGAEWRSRNIYKLKTLLSVFTYSCNKFKGFTTWTLYSIYICV